LLFAGVDLGSRLRQLGDLLVDLRDKVGLVGGFVEVAEVLELAKGQGVLLAQDQQVGVGAGGADQLGGVGAAAAHQVDGFFEARAGDFVSPMLFGAVGPGA